MHRRSFLSLSAVPVLANAAEHDPQADWHETVSTDALKLTAETVHRKITLQVELIGPDVTAQHIPFKNPKSTILIRKSHPLPLPRLPLRRRRHGAHRMGTPRRMRLPFDHPLDREQIRSCAETSTLPAA